MSFIESLYTNETGSSIHISNTVFGYILQMCYLCAAYIPDGPGLQRFINKWSLMPQQLPSPHLIGIWYYVLVYMRV